jgi:hypothetical protein
MPRTAERTVDLPQPAAAVFEALGRVLTSHGARIAESDPAAGRIVARTSFSLASYGETLVMTVAPNTPGGTRLTIRSTLKWGLVDWGKNRRNLDRMVDGLTALLAADPSSAGPPGDARPAGGPA